MQHSAPGNGTSPTTTRKHYLSPSDILVCKETDTRVRDLEGASADELRRHVVALDMKIAKIERDLAAARERGEATGEPPDPDWVRRAGSALKLTRVARVQLQHMLGSARDAEKARNLERWSDGARTFERHFVRAAKDTLPPETFAELCRDAEAAMAAQEVVR